MYLSFNNLIILTICALGIYTTVLFYISFFDNRSKLKDPKPPKILPSVAICVPFYNEKENTLKTVDSLVKLKYPKNKLNIIIINDGSTDNSYDLIKKHLDQKNYSNVKLYSKKNGGKFTALNLALKKCDCDIFGVLDADSVVDSQALLNMIGYFKEKDVVSVTPSMKLWPNGNILQKVQQVEFFIGIWLRKIFSFMDAIHVTPGPFSLFRKSFFDKYGNYHKAHMTEDIEIALRIQSYHYKIKNSLNAHVYTHGPRDLKSLNKQRVRWYLGFIKNTWDYKNLFSKNYSNLGLVFLPLAYLSVLFVILSLIYQIIKFIITSIDNLRILFLSNFDVFRFNFKFDSFFINFNPPIIISFVSFMFMVIMIYHAFALSKKKEKSLFSPVIYFMFLYYFLYAYWWIKSIFFVILKKELNWNHKSET